MVRIITRTASNTIGLAVGAPDADALVIGDRNWPLLPWMDQRQQLATMFAVDREVGIKCEDTVVIEKLGHPDQTGIGQGHRPVMIFSPKRSNLREVLLQMECNPESTALQKIEKHILRGG